MKWRGWIVAAVVPAIAGCDVDADPVATQIAASKIASSTPAPPSSVVEAVPYSGDLAGFASSMLGVKTYDQVTLDLNADGHSEHLVLARENNWCGTGGCHIFIVSQSGDTFTLVNRIPAITRPVRLLDTSHNGWRDLGYVSRFDATKHHEGRLIFDGAHYIRTDLQQIIERTDNLEGELLIDVIDLDSNRIKNGEVN